MGEMKRCMKDFFGRFEKKMEEKKEDQAHAPAPAPAPALNLNAIP